MDNPSLIEVLLHLDKHLGSVINQYQGWTYAILFGLIFCETGFVIMPFLPGDTLLLAAGLFANPIHAQLNIFTLLFLLTAASILGDNTNFWIGRFLGRSLYSNPNSKIFKRSHLEHAEQFFEKHGAKAIILGKFLAVVRTVVPFVAGMDAMPYRKFFTLSVISAFVWVWTCTLAGYFLGQIAFVRDNFELVILGILGLTVLLVAKEAYFSRREKHRKAVALDARDKLGQTEAP
ncbi:MAG: VTT domain-containing protein [Fimbriimonadaceae bacterium]|nr:VTT domain-containing protein [Fimbriimonadaceae bacterium]QYK56161.1 MAG: VTT domain-containing protein [Fimbriimonadaceae bacterium]